MKVVYVISSINKVNGGTGGHYYSLISLATAMNSMFEVLIVNIGTQKSIAIENSKLKVYNIIDQDLNTFRLLTQLHKLLCQEGSYVLHAYDHLAYFYARVVSVFLRVPVLLTKCGGRNPKVYYPYSKYMVTFSNENFLYFKNKRKFKKAILYLLPNRVLPFDYDHKRTEDLKSKYELNRFRCVFFRITRINEVYKESIIQLINIASECNKRGIHSCVLIIGTVESKTIADYIKSYSDISIFLEEDSYFTENAKKLLGLADVVLGTGRGFMEAALKEKLMLAPLNESPFPVLIKPNNFDLIFSTNFSSRCIIENYDLNTTMDELCILLTNNTKYRHYLEEMIPLYIDNFSVMSKIETYKNIYESMESNNKININDLILNYLYLLRTYYCSKKKYMDRLR